MIDKAFDRVARVIELALALAFIFAVLLNFANVIGRYLLGISLLGSDEVQIFIMVGMTFLGAAVVTRRNLHLRMDVLVQFFPTPIQILLRIVEQVLLIALAGFVLTQSYFYARQMLRIGRTSDMAGVPMWIPHGTVALGFALMLIVAVWGLIRHGATNDGTRRRRRDQVMTFALAVVPIALLLLGFPIFMVLLTAVTVALVFFMHVPLAALHQNLFASVNGFALLAIPFFIYAGELMGRGSVAQRLVDFVQGGVGSVRGSLGVTAVGTSAIFGAISGASAATVATIGKVMVPGDAARRLSRDLHRRAHHRGRRDRRDHPAQHSDDRLWRGGGRVGCPPLCCRRHSRTDDRGHARRLRRVAGKAREFRGGRAVRSQAFPARCRAQPVGAGRAGHHPRRHLRRRILADRGGRRRVRLCGAGDRLRVPRAQAGATSSKPPPPPCCSPAKSSSSWPAPACSRGS